MTRWARGKNANKKKPHEGSEWTDMKESVKTKQQNSMSKECGSQKEQLKNVKKTVSKPLKKQHLKKPVLGDVKSPVVKADEDKVPEAISGWSIIDELEGRTKEAKQPERQIEKHVLEEFFRKDRRRENRRLKRQEEKQQARVCFNCRERGHDMSSCPQVTKDIDQGTGICFKCGSTEHKIHQCKVRVQQGKFPFAKCFICGEMGHLSRSCPDNPKGLYPNGGCCLHCGSVEHFKRDCPKLQKLKGITETALPTLDTFTNVEEEPSLVAKNNDCLQPPVKKAKIVKF